MLLQDNREQNTMKATLCSECKPKYEKYLHE